MLKTSQAFDQVCHSRPLSARASGFFEAENGTDGQVLASIRAAAAMQGNIPGYSVRRPDQTLSRESAGLCEVYAMHFLTTSPVAETLFFSYIYWTEMIVDAGRSDVICVVCSLPLFAFGARGVSTSCGFRGVNRSRSPGLCVQKGCLGPMLTLVPRSELEHGAPVVATLSGICVRSSRCPWWTSVPSARAPEN